jgi:protein O-GlcNAc transferase
LSDDQMCERIRQDGIDILVDLSGHTLNNRLKVFARKPAPVQVTWMGYVTTTGLSAMDYRLTHEDADPLGSENEYTEQLVRLPGTMWCFRPLPGMPPVAPPPFQRKGHITFGAFNRYSKVRKELIDCWIAIVAAVPASRLVMCIPEGRIRNEVAARFLRGGVQPQRLTFFSKLEHDRFWALHADVDIALDPFPFNGGTTTCETLWLGVPVVTCTGGPGSFTPRFASRMGAAFLKAVQLAELVTHNEADYVATAVALAGDPERLSRLRAGLRSRMAESALTDEARFVREVEAAYRSMWHSWLAGSHQ